MVKQMEKGKKRIQTVYWSLVGMASALLISAAAGDGRHDLGSFFDDHEGCVRPTGGNQYDCRCYGGGDCPAGSG